MRLAHLMFGPTLANGSEARTHKSCQSRGGIQLAGVGEVDAVGIHGIANRWCPALFRSSHYLMLMF